MTHPACNYLVPPKDRALQRAVDGNGREYGHWCCSGKHVWSESGDAEKCCNPEWMRCMGVQTINDRTFIHRLWVKKVM